MKYSYEFTLQNTVADSAKTFIEEQFRNTDFKKLNADEALVLVSNKAWNDAMSYVGRFIITDRAAKNKMQEKAFTAIKDYIDAGVILADYATAGIPDMDLPHDFALGVWQKYASMVFKYLYCIQILNIKKGFHWFELAEYAKCKCPVDRLIARSVFSMLPFDRKEERALAWFLSGNNPEEDIYKNISWSKITEEEYTMFQNAVAEICNSFDEKLIPLQFDLLFWEPANILDKQGMEKYKA